MTTRRNSTRNHKNIGNTKKVVRRRRYRLTPLGKLCVFIMMALIIMIGTIIGVNLKHKKADMEAEKFEVVSKEVIDWSTICPDIAYSRVIVDGKVETYYMERPETLSHRYIQNGKVETIYVTTEEVLSSPDLMSEPETLEINTLEREIPISDAAFEVIVLAVQHEVGKNPEYFPGQDFDKIQRAMASVIWNRIQSPLYPNNVWDVLEEAGQFPGLWADIQHYWTLSNADMYDINDQRTRNNVLAVIYGEDEFSDDLFFEMCTLNATSYDEAWTSISRNFNSVEMANYGLTADNRYIMFAKPITV